MLHNESDHKQDQNICTGTIIHHPTYYYWYISLCIAPFSKRLFWHAPIHLRTLAWCIFNALRVGACKRRYYSPSLSPQQDPWTERMPFGMYHSIYHSCLFVVWHEESSMLNALRVGACKTIHCPHHLSHLSSILAQSNANSNGVFFLSPTR